MTVCMSTCRWNPEELVDWGGGGGGGLWKLRKTGYMKETEMFQETEKFSWVPPTSYSFMKICDHKHHLQASDLKIIDMLLGVTSDEERRLDMKKTTCYTMS